MTGFVNFVEKTFSFFLLLAREIFTCEICERECMDLRRHLSLSHEIRYKNRHLRPSFNFIIILAVLWIRIGLNADPDLDPAFYVKVLIQIQDFDDQNCKKTAGKNLIF
jgi:hypothetical protein